MSDTNGSPVTRAELAAHIKGIDQQFKDVADDISEIKFGIHGISEAMRRAGADSFLGGRGRKLDRRGRGGVYRSGCRGCRDVHPLMRWSYAVWGGWLVVFLLLELPGNQRWVPWVTLSETVWALEARGWPLKALVLGLTVGLVVHFVFQTNLVKAEAVSVVVALAAHLINKHWP
jgi:hypothetical protein